MTLLDARERFGAIGVAPHDCEIKTGFVEFAPDETSAELIARVDGQLES